MKNMFKYISLFLLATFSMFADVVSGTFASGITLLSTNSTSIRNIQLTDTSGAANTVVVYDNDSASSTNRVYLAYTSVVQYTTNVVMSFTNFTGVAQSYTNTVLKTDNISVGPATNQARRVFTFRLPANGTVTFTPTYAAGTTFGLQLSATGAGGYNADIQPLGVQ
jgi:hypothetical protein